MRYLIIIQKLFSLIHVIYEWKQLNLQTSDDMFDKCKWKQQAFLTNTIPVWCFSENGIQQIVILRGEHVTGFWGHAYQVYVRHRLANADTDHPDTLSAHALCRDQHLVQVCCQSISKKDDVAGHRGSSTVGWSTGYLYCSLHIYNITCSPIQFKVWFRITSKIFPVEFLTLES